MALFWVLLGLIVLCVTYPLFNKNKRYLIWSPITFISIYFFYYTCLPVFSNSEEVYNFRHLLESFYFVALLNFVSILIGFQVRLPNIHFNNFNNLFQQVNYKRLGIILGLIAFVSYGVTQGFKINLYSDHIEKEFDPTASYGHTKSYISYLVSLFCISTCLLYVGSRKSKSCYVYLLIVFLTAFSIFVMGGFRYRILILIVCLICFIFLYSQKKLQIKTMVLMIPLFLIFYYFMGFMQVTRSYGRGIDLERLNTYVDKGELQESKENLWVFECSAIVIDIYSSEKYDKIGFEPVTTALTMPIPRAIFPEKPKGDYLRTITGQAGFSEGLGMAFLNFVEGYVSFGYLGVILYGLITGFLSKIFWMNYRNARSKIGSIYLLSVWNGLLFMIISRGYLAAHFMLFIYYMIIPFWLVMLMKYLPGGRKFIYTIK